MMESYASFKGVFYEKYQRVRKYFIHYKQLKSWSNTGYLSDEKLMMMMIIAIMQMQEETNCTFKTV